MNKALSVGGLAVLVSCGPGGDLDRVQIDDGDDVRRVTTLAAVWEGAEPAVLTVLTEAGNSPDSVFFERVAAATLLPSGGMAVLDAGARQILVFDTDGQLDSKLGRRGQGPGELSRPLTLTSVAGDSLVVFDGSLDRVTWFALDGGVRTRQLSGEAFTPPPVRVWPSDDGGLLIFDGARQSARVVTSQGDAQLVSPPASLRMMSREGAEETLWRSAIASEMLQVGTMLFEVPFGRATRMTVVDNRVAIVHPDSAIVTQIVDGRRTVSVLPLANVALSSSEVGTAAASARAAAADAGIQLLGAEVYDPHFQPPLRPPFREVVVSPDGRMLVREWALRGTRGSPYWLVAPNGAFSGRVRFPEDADVLYFHGDEALLLRRSPLGEHSVQRVRIDWENLQEEVG